LDEDLGLSPKISDGSDAYKTSLRKLISYIKGNRRAIVVELERDMKTAAGLHDFERAASLRNKLRAMQELKRRVMFGDKEFLDISKDKALADLAKLLGLKNIPVRIEGYDISNLGNEAMVGSMVVFNSREAIKSQYKKFKIKSVFGQSDVDCLREILQRRLKHSDWPMPDLILVDGGKPQFNIVKKVLKENNFDISVVGIAKGQERNKNEFFFDRTNNFVMNNKELLIKIRDEAHRFAINYQRSLKRKNLINN
jgi:excinuclease ABC subunit C